MPNRNDRSRFGRHRPARAEERDAGPHDRDDPYFDPSRYYDPDRDMGGSEWSGASGRGGMTNFGGQREHGGFSNYAGGGSRDDRQWGRDRDRYDRDWSGRDYDRFAAMDFGRDYARAPGEPGYGMGGYGGASGYGGADEQGWRSSGEGGRGRPTMGRGYGGYGMTGPRGMGDMTERGRWPSRGTDLGFASPDHEDGGRGPHFGKGPKGWRRSDDRIREDVCERIAQQGWIDASEVEVRVESGTVILSGTIADRRSKRTLEHVAEDVSGVDDVRNEIRVRREGTETPRANERRDEKPPHQNGNRARS